jgi:hypothetical protein
MKSIQEGAAQQQEQVDQSEANAVAELTGVRKEEEGQGGC